MTGWKIIDIIVAMKAVKIVKYIIIFMVAIFVARCFWSLVADSGPEKEVAAAVAPARTSEVNPSERMHPSAAKLNLPEDFRENVLEHIKKLSSFGIRTAGSKSEPKAVDYISNFMKQTGIETKIERFSFKYYDSENVSVTINGKAADTLLTCIDPFDDSNISGRGIAYDPNNPADQGLKGEIVLAGGTNSIYKLLQFEPKALLMIDEAYLNTIEASGDINVNLDISGKSTELSSYNIIGTVHPLHKTDMEVIISAHWDSTGGPGASDNASGVGILLELSKYYSARRASLPYNVKFIALGAEELGFIGAKAYVAGHEGELKNCKLDFNVDEVGGDKGIHIEMGNLDSRGEAKLQSVYSDLKAMTDYNGNWIFNRSIPICSNVPDWLKACIEKSCNELNCNVRPGTGMDSDHVIFALEGIPSTNIYADGDIINHSPDDTPDKISTGSLLESGEIMVSVIDKVLAGIVVN